MVISIVLIISMMIVIAVFIGFIYLQFMLCKKEEKWKGLVLPIITFVISLFFVIGSIAYTSEYTTSQTIDEDGKVVVEQKSGGHTNIDLTATGITFMIYNIPTLVFLGIYVNQKRSDSTKQQMNKMNIQDI